MTKPNEIDVEIQFDLEDDGVNQDELKHVLEFMPEILKQVIRQTESEKQE